MSGQRQFRFWLLGLLLFLAAIYLLPGCVDLLAVPTAASIGVLIRFAVNRHRQSRFYRGDPPWPSFPST